MIRSLLLCLALLVTGCPQKGATAPTLPAVPPTPEEVVSAVSARVEQYRQGYEVRSPEALEPLYVKTDELVVTAQGRTHKGFAAVREWLASFLGQCESFKARLTDVRVTALGESGALVVATLHRSYGTGVQTVDEIGTLTLVFRRQGEEWLILNEHYSYGPASS